MILMLQKVFGLVDKILLQKLNKSYFRRFYQTSIDHQTISPPQSQMAPFNSQNNWHLGYKLGIFSDFIYYFTNYLRVYIIKLAFIMQIGFSEI